jgi:hypothetical protein
LALCVAFALHVLDEALTGFLDVYNPTVTALRERWAWFPMPTWEYREWLVALVVACAICFALTPLAFRGSAGLRVLAWVFAAIMLLNGLGHMLFTVLGRTVESVHFARPAPGFYSSPALIGSAWWVMVRLGRRYRMPHEKSF